MSTAEAERLDAALTRAFTRGYPLEVAAALEDRSVDETAELLAHMPAAEFAPVLSHLSPDTAVRVLARLDESTATKLVAALEPSVAARLLSRIDSEPREVMLGHLDSRDAAELRQLLTYSEHTAGALMDPRAFALRPETSARDALKRLRDLADRSIRRVFLVDAEQRLIGAVGVGDLAVSADTTLLEQLADGRIEAVSATASREEVVETLNRTGATGLPVVDFEGRLLGVIRHNALLEAAREEVSADVQSMFGAGKEERALSRVLFAVRKRLPWLQINLATAFLAASVVGLFESTIARYTALAVLLPVVAGQSGNTGAQALAVTMRGLALREIRPRQWLRVCVKETNVGLINGVAVALTTSVAVLIWSRSPGLALVIGSSMVFSMIAAGFAGAGIPMVLSAVGQDPAQSSSIILTTVTDVVGFFTFLGLATVLAGML